MVHSTIRVCLLAMWNALHTCRFYLYTSRHAPSLTRRIHLLNSIQPLAHLPLCAPSLTLYPALSHHVACPPTLLSCLVAVLLGPSPELLLWSMVIPQGVLQPLCLLQRAPGLCMPPRPGLRMPPHPGLSDASVHTSVTTLSHCSATLHRRHTVLWLHLSTWCCVRYSSHNCIWESIHSRSHGWEALKTCSAVLSKVTFPWLKPRPHTCNAESLAASSCPISPLDSKRHLHHSSLRGAHLSIPLQSVLLRCLLRLCYLARQLGLLPQPPHHGIRLKGS